MKARHGCTFAVLILLAACSGKRRPFADTPIEGLGGSSGIGAPAAEQGSEATTPSLGIEPTAAEGEPLGGAPVATLLPPDDAVQSSGSLACQADGGACTEPDAGPTSPTCDPGPRDCTSDADNDCDGQSDDVPDDVCVCLPGAVEPCDEHPGLDGRGQCLAGTRTCIAAEGNVASDWGACEGAQGPAEADSCVPQDDGDCDGTANEGCDCVDGVTQPCGPPNDFGVCQRGTQTCVGGSFGDCVDEAFGGARDCRSNADNDCDGRTDNARDNVCQCAIGQTQPCQEHPQDGIGRCRAGTQMCLAGQGNSSSFFGACSGSVGPGQRDCRSQQDNDCDGRADNARDNVCQCAIGSTQACEQHPGQDGVGQCRAGSQQCLAGQNNATSFFGACSGSVGPAQRDTCTSVNDADCSGTANDDCQCVSSRGNADCSSNANASRCNGATGQCVGCQSNADCSLVSGGRNVCQAGRCIQNLLGSGATCTQNAQCQSGRCDRWFQDLDGDRHGSASVSQSTCASDTGGVQPLGFVSNSDDCCDLGGNNRTVAAQIFTGQAELFTAAQTVCPEVDDFDYNCSSSIEYKYQEDTEEFGTCGNVPTAQCDVTRIWLGGRNPGCGLAFAPRIEICFFEFASGSCRARSGGLNPQGTTETNFCQ